MAGLPIKRSPMPKWPRCALLLLLSLSVAVNAFCVNNAASSEFRDPTPQERAMTSVAFAPGAPAVVLNWDQDVNDRDGYRSEYVRIKILSEEGKKYGNVEVPHIGLLSEVNHIKARTVRPDGTIAPFDGKTFDKVVIKIGGVRLIAKTFTLSDVQVGSIIEYRYDVANRGGMVYDSEFAVQREIPVVHEEFSLQPHNFPGYQTFFSFRSLPPGKRPEMHGETYEMTLENIPPFEEEPLAPPPATLKPRLQFWYTNGTTDAPAFWTRQAHEWADVIEPFIGDGREVREAATAALEGAATPEEKLRKLYARVQQIRNLSFEPEKTDGETRKLRENHSAQDVLRNGYGTLRDINRLFVAMARAVGLDAHVLRIGERDEQFLAKNLPLGNQLDGEVAIITAGSKTYYLDPSTPYAPFGTLSWQKSHTSGLLIARGQKEAIWVDTPRQPADAAATRRVAALVLDNGVVRGTAVITYRGQEALRHRFRLRNDDEAAARTALEKAMNSLFPEGTIVKVTDVSDLRATEASLVVTATVELPSAASLVGSRAMVPLAVFTAAQKNPFPSEQRKNSIYFHYAYGVEDDVTLKVPAGYDVESLPAPLNIDMGALRYAATYQKGEGVIRLNRKMVVETEIISREQYSLVRSFFSKTETADQEPVVMRKQASPAGSTP
jgi:hypothetical protein